MNNNIKMKIKNEDGKEIVKEVPSELYSNYLSIGWEVVKEVKNNKPLTRDNLRIDKDKENENL